MRGTHIYYYSTFEVRIPTWNEDIESTTTNTVALGFDNEMCSTSNAKPYNRNRIKSETGRFTLDEILADFSSSSYNIYDIIRQHVVQSMNDLQASIQNKFSTMATPPESNEFQLTQIAIAGIDVMVDKDYTPYIVELNNNPAMASEHKLMSDAYKLHLIAFVQNMVLFGNSKEDNGYGFSKIW
jgi:hypothetical protein